MNLVLEVIFRLYLFVIVFSESKRTDTRYPNVSVNIVIQTLNELYKLYAGPHLDYDEVIYHISQKVCDFSHEVTLHRLMERLESVKYSAGLAITGAWKGTSRDKIYEELGWESLNDRRWSRLLALFFKLINELAPEYTRHSIPRIRWSNYALRNQAVVGRINARTERFLSQVSIQTA